MSEEVKVAVIATGLRSRTVVQQLLKDSGVKVQVVAVFDPDRAQCERAIQLWNSPEAAVCETYEEAIHSSGVEWVMVFSPNGFHKEHILAAFAAGKHVFSEKPLATSIEDCQEIFDAHQKSGLIFATGFVLRYSALYRAAKELIGSGRLGRIISIDANENIPPVHGEYIMSGWRRRTELAGPHILEKCCHDIDLLNWFCESLPSKVASFGGLDFFVPKNEYLMEKYGKEAFVAWDNPHREPSPFLSDKNLMDNQVSILQYRNNIRVTFQATMSNPIPERRMYFSCTEGTLIVELYASSLRYRCMGETTETIIHYNEDAHGGGDAFIMKELLATMFTGKVPVCSGDEGLESAVVALALSDAAKSEQIIDLEPLWNQLDR